LKTGRRLGADAREASYDSRAGEKRVMRIFEVAPFAAPIDERGVQLGGAQVLIADLAHGLASRGHAVTLAAANGSLVSGVTLADLDIDSAGLRRADLGPRDAPRADDAEQRAAFMRVREWLEAHEIDVVHAHAYDAPAFDVLSGAPRPVLHTLHLPPLDAVVVRAARAAQGATFATVSAANARAWTMLGVAVRHVIHNGVDLTRIPFSTRRGDHLLYAGRISPEKGVATAIDIAARAGRGLVIVGGVYDEAYFARAIAPRVRRESEPDPYSPVRGAVYLGARAREEVYRLMGGAAVTLLPVQWEEPFGLVAVESLAAGTPVVGYRRGGLAEIVDSGSGVLVRPGDEAELVRAVDRATALDPHGCRRRAERFGLAAMIGGYEALLEDLASP